MAPSRSRLAEVSFEPSVAVVIASAVALDALCRRSERRTTAEIVVVAGVVAALFSPVDRLAADRQAMLPYEPAIASLEVAARVRLRTPLPVESLQHPLSVYGELLAEVGR